MEGRDELVSLSELGAGADRGLTGRGVYAGDGTLLGRVDEVLGDAGGDGPRSLAVLLDPSVARQAQPRRAYVPFSAARVDDAGRVHLDTVTGTGAPDLPHHPGEPLPDDEATLLQPRDSHADGVAVRMTLSEEALSLQTREVSAGELTIRKRVETERVREPITLQRDEVEVERRPAAPGTGPEPRFEDGVTYIPLVEEELVVTKRMVVREELVVRRRRVDESQVVEETLRRERAEVEEPPRDRG